LLMTIVARRAVVFDSTTPSRAQNPLASSSIQTPVNPQNPGFSPLAHGLPFGMAPPHAQQQPAGDTTLANQILGPFADCPVVHQIMSSVPSMSEVQLQNLRDILQREPATRDDIGMLSEHLVQRQRELAAAQMT
jgi:hypothetical protein